MMIDLRNLSSAILEQPTLEPGNAIKMPLDEHSAILVELSELEQHELLSYLKGGFPASHDIHELATLLRTSYDSHLTDNLIGSITVDGEYAYTKPYFDGFQSACNLESDLALMVAAFGKVFQETLSTGADRNAPVGNWMQV